MLPKSLVADRGQFFMREELKDLCCRLGINREPNPKKGPWLKDQIERLFETDHTSFISGLPGTSSSNEEDDKDSDQ